MVKFFGRRRVYLLNIKGPINPIKSEEEYLLSIEAKISLRICKILMNSGSEVIKFDDLVG